MTTPANPLINSLWPGLAIWSALYISDYAMTLWGARLYRAGAGEKIVFEGSYELTPYFQADIDSLRLISPRFVRVLVLNGLLLSFLWWISISAQLAFYEFALGALILSQLAVHKRHLSNVFLFRAINAGNGARGRIEYSRHLTLRMSSLELLSFSGLFLTLFLFHQSWFLLGGVCACLSIAAKHWKLARRCLAPPGSPSGVAATTPEGAAQS